VVIEEAADKQLQLFVEKREGDEKWLDGYA